MTQVLNQLAASLGRADCTADRSNVTRKELAAWRGESPLTDVPAGDLHRLDLRPTLEELIDAAALAHIQTAFTDDIRLHKEALRTFDAGTIARVLSRI